MAIADVISALQPLGPPDPYDVESWQQALPRPSPADLFGQPQLQPGIPPVFNLSPEEMRLEQLQQLQRNREIVNNMQINQAPQRGARPGPPNDDDPPFRPPWRPRKHWMEQYKLPGEVTMLPMSKMGIY